MKSGKQRDINDLQHEVDHLRMKNHRLVDELQEAIEMKEYWMNR